MRTHSDSGRMNRISAEVTQLCSSATCESKTSTRMLAIYRRGRLATGSESGQEPAGEIEDVDDTIFVEIPLVSE